jgi:hypothetical protein
MDVSCVSEQYGVWSFDEKYTVPNMPQTQRLAKEPV